MYLLVGQFLLSPHPDAVSTFKCTNYRGFNQVMSHPVTSFSLQHNGEQEKNSVLSHL